MEFHLENTEVFGLEKSVIASGNPMRTVMSDNTAAPTDKDYKRAAMLGNTGLGQGHSQFLAGITVEFDMYAPLYMWKEIQRYHFLNFVSSQSTMHRLAKFNVKEQCVSDTDPEILARYQVLLDAYNKDIADGKFKPEEDKTAWRRLVASLPCGFVLGATIVTSYLQLKTMYYQRKNHRLKEWHEFCDWCETLPKFKELCLNKTKEE